MGEKKFMDIALDEAYAGIRAKDGGPFGCVVVKDGEVVGRGHNRVLLKKDATCHGEMEAIRDASKNLGTHDLSGCELYTTAEPCPMCLGAIMWSNIEQVYYGCTIKDTDSIGFRDDRFYEFLNGEGDFLHLESFDRESCLTLFKEFNNLEHDLY